ncbi:hypothetical protein ACFE04_009622 [Oxalis oulophora]
MEKATPPSAQMVGNAFVEQYYQILNKSPGVVHRFYQDVSYLSRPENNGEMTTVTTMQAINEKIMSLNYEDFTVEIKTADAQDSFGKGVIVLVTGSFTGKDGVCKKFSQTFFLAPQDEGYFVLNDVFRYNDENKYLSAKSIPINEVNENVQNVELPPEPEPTPVLVPETVEPTPPVEVQSLENGAVVSDNLAKEEESVVENVVVEAPTQIIESQNLKVVDPVPIAQEDAPKKSYANILKEAKRTITAWPVSVPAVKVKPAPEITDRESVGFVKPSPVPEAPVPAGESAPESSNVNEEVEGPSIYVRNLSYNVTNEQLEEAFKKFGPVKPNGIQIRSNKQGSCFGFVEFETANAVQSAIEASPLIIGDREAIVEEKRATRGGGGGGGGRGRYNSGRGSFRSDSFRNRGSFGGPRGGYGRSESRNQGGGEFAGRGRGSFSRNGEGYHRAN